MISSLSRTFEKWLSTISEEHVQESKERRTLRHKETKPVLSLMRQETWMSNASTFLHPGHASGKLTKRCSIETKMAYWTISLLKEKTKASQHLSSEAVFSPAHKNSSSCLQPSCKDCFPPTPSLTISSNPSRPLTRASSQALDDYKTTSQRTSQVFTDLKSRNSPQIRIRRYTQPKCQQSDLQMDDICYYDSDEDGSKDFFVVASFPNSFS